MSNKSVIFFFICIMSFDMFVLFKAMHPTASQNYINYFIKNNISTKEYNTNELYDYNALKEASPGMEDWRFRPICEDINHHCNLPRKH